MQKLLYGEEQKDNAYPLPGPYVCDTAFIVLSSAAAQACPLYCAVSPRSSSASSPEPRVLSMPCRRRAVEEIVAQRSFKNSKKSSKAALEYAARALPPSAAPVGILEVGAGRELFGYARDARRLNMVEPFPGATASGLHCFARPRRIYFPRFAYETAKNL